MLGPLPVHPSVGCCPDTACNPWQVVRRLHQQTDSPPGPTVPNLWVGTPSHDLY